jgi:hypothetical protein
VSSKVFANDMGASLFDIEDLKAYIAQSRYHQPGFIGVFLCTGQIRAGYDFVAH